MTAADVLALGIAPTLASPASSDDSTTFLGSSSFRELRGRVRRNLHWFVSEDHRMRHEHGTSRVPNVNVLDLTHDAICVRSTSDVIEYWNRGAEELYGWTAGEAVGRVSHVLFKTVFPAQLDQIEANLMRTGCWEGELVHTLKDGTRVTVASRWSLLRDAASQPIAIVETNSDITERKRAEAERAKLEQRLRQAEKMEAIGRFASGIAHDFNNVLGGIIAYGEMLLDEAPPNTPHKRYAQNVLTAATRGRELVEQILAYSAQPARQARAGRRRPRRGGGARARPRLVARVDRVASHDSGAAADRHGRRHAAAPDRDEPLQQCDPRDEAGGLLHVAIAPVEVARRPCALARDPDGRAVTCA